MGNKKVAYIFPGQGAQYVGMGKELCLKFVRAQSVFEKADQILGFGLSEICFNGPPEKLTQSAICQPAILTLSIAAYEVLKNEFVEESLMPSACAGLSLGEYSALVACGSLNFEDALWLVNKRGQFMDEASLENPGTMLCVLGLELEKVQLICKDSKAEIANLNCPGQVIISGSNDSIAKANELAQKEGAKITIKLDVSGPFHSRLMQPAADKLKKELDKVSIRKPMISFVPNVTADYVDDVEQIKELLTQQVAHTTYWEKSIITLKNNMIYDYFEIGPGKVLRGLLQRIDRNLKVINLGQDTDFVNLREKLGGAL